MSSNSTNPVILTPDPWDVVTVLGTFAEGILWGFYCFLFLSCMSMLYALKRKNSITYLLAFITTGLFSLCTAHFALYCQHVTSILWISGVTGVQYGDQITISADFLSALALFFGDLTLIYRLWLFYRSFRWRSALVAFITLLDVAGLVMAITCDSNFANIVTVGEPWIYDVDTITALYLAANALPLATNILITFLILGRAMYFWRQLTWTKAMEPRASRAVVIILESGFMFTVIQMLVVVLHQEASPAYSIITSIATQLYGIAPTLITAGIASGVVSEHPHGQSRTTNIGTLTLPAFDVTETTAYTDDSQKYETQIFSNVSLTDKKCLDSPV